MNPPSMMVLATRNRGKAREFQDMLKHFPITLKHLDEFGPIPEVVEDGLTFDENAYKKANHAANALGLPAIADDSGLVVEALAGAPGVRSARYAGPAASDTDNIRKLLSQMEGQTNRKAAFECVISIAVPGGPALTYEARCEGEITYEPRGKGGFGYDPVFFFPPLGRTFAEIPSEEKNRLSHRGKALHEVAMEFDKILEWIGARLAAGKPHHHH